MSYLTVYLGSDHVIQHPKFDFQKDYLSATSSQDDVIKKACSKNVVGVLNTYQINLDSVSVRTPNQQVINGFDCFDVLLSDDSADNSVTICSSHALSSMQFVGASFVRQ